MHETDTDHAVFHTPHARSRQWASGKVGQCGYQRVRIHMTPSDPNLQDAQRSSNQQTRPTPSASELTVPNRSIFSTISLLDILVPAPLSTTIKDTVGAREAQDSGPTTRTPRAYIRGLVRKASRGSMSAFSCASTSVDVVSSASRSSEVDLTFNSSSEGITLAASLGEGKESA